MKRGKGTLVGPFQYITVALAATPLQYGKKRVKDKGECAKGKAVVLLVSFLVDMCAKKSAEERLRREAVSIGILCTEGALCTSSNRCIKAVARK